MRIITAEQISAAVAELCIRANRELPEDIVSAMNRVAADEPWPVAKNTLEVLCRNIAAAEEMELPVCQDTGMACVFVWLGQDVHIEGDFRAAVDEGVRRGYELGYLRKSVVADPLRRVNTGDNTPAVITLELVPGEKLELTVLPKGFGSENMSRLAMLKPADGVEGANAILEKCQSKGPDLYCIPFKEVYGHYQNKGPGHSQPYCESHKGFPQLHLLFYQQIYTGHYQKQGHGIYGNAIAVHAQAEHHHGNTKH